MKTPKSPNFANNPSLVGLWSLPAEGAARWIKRIKAPSGCALYTNIKQAVRGIASLVPQVNDELQMRAEKRERGRFTGLE